MHESININKYIFHTAKTPIEDEGIILHITDSDLNLFPVSDTETKKIETKEDCVPKQQLNNKRHCREPRILQE